MAKLVKQKYTNVSGERKIYSYLLAITKSQIIDSGINPDKPINIKVESGKLVITN